MPRWTRRVSEQVRRQSLRASGHVDWHVGGGTASCGRLQWHALTAVTASTYLWVAFS